MKHDASEGDLEQLERDELARAEMVRNAIREARELLEWAPGALPAVVQLALAEKAASVLADAVYWTPEDSKA
jgi:hypothetical protein